MKILKYKLCSEINCGTDDKPQIEQTFSDVEMGWNPENEEIAKREAYNGEYTIEDDGEPEPPPSDAEQLRADVDFLLMLAEEG